MVRSEQARYDVEDGSVARSSFITAPLHNPSAEFFTRDASGRVFAQDGLGKGRVRHRLLRLNS